MNIQTDKSYMIFRKDGQYGAMYSVGLSKKDQNGKYINAYYPVRFKKDVEVENKTTIYIKKAWHDFFITKDNKPNFFIFISEFETIENTIKDAKKESDPFKEFSEEINITSADLPF